VVPRTGAKWDTGLEAQLCYEIKTFLLAGHETSAAMLTWSVYELSQSNEITQKVGAMSAGNSVADVVSGTLATEGAPQLQHVPGMSHWRPMHNRTTAQRGHHCAGILTEHLALGVVVEFRCVRRPPACSAASSLTSHLPGVRSTP
jgi:hypothetical protein